MHGSTVQNVTFITRELLSMSGVFFIRLCICKKRNAVPVFQNVYVLCIKMA